MNIKKAFDYSQTIIDALPNLLSSFIACLDNLLQADLLSVEFRADGATQKVVVMEDANLPDIAWIIPNRHLFADIRGQGGIQIVAA